MGGWVAGIICDFANNKIHYNVAGNVSEAGGKIRVVEKTGVEDLTLKKEDVLNKMVMAELSHTIPEIIELPDIMAGKIVDFKEWNKYIDNVSNWFKNEVIKYNDVIAGFFIKVIPED